MEGDGDDLSDLMDRGDDLAMEEEEDDDDNAMIIDEEGFHIALLMMCKKYGEYIAAQGPTAQEHLKECVGLLDRLAWSLECVSVCIRFSITMIWGLGLA